VRQAALNPGAFLELDRRDQAGCPSPLEIFLYEFRFGGCYRIEEKMTTDSELLGRFTRSGAEDAFAELVRRHVNLVYSAALRQVGGDTHLAQDAAQTVFADLARKAPALTRRASLTGWLYTSARFAAANIVRAERRRHGREEKFMRERNEPSPELEWGKLRPVLDEVMHGLNETDREAILLRYFENRSFREIGVRCGLNENAARKRVERALERLRGLLGKAGVTTAAALASLISTHAVQVAPANLAATLTATSLASAGTETFLFWNILNLTKAKIALGALLVIGTSAALVVGEQARRKLTVENRTLTQRIAQLTADRQSLSRLAAQAQRPASLPDTQFLELLQLRGEAGRLRDQTNEIARLRQENRKLLSKLGAEPESTNQVSVEDRFTLRLTHVQNAVRTLLGAVKSYAVNHDGQYPAGFDQLTSSGALAISNFAGGLALSDFEWANDGAPDVHGGNAILRLRTPIPNPMGANRTMVMVTGGLDDNGVPCTSEVNVTFPEPAQDSRARDQ